jgi:hypothetical protein
MTAFFLSPFFIIAQGERDNNRLLLQQLSGLFKKKEHGMSFFTPFILLVTTLILFFILSCIKKRSRLHFPYGIRARLSTPSKTQEMVLIINSVATLLSAIATVVTALIALLK